jgi:hypothetical protein
VKTAGARVEIPSKHTLKTSLDIYRCVKSLSRSVVLSIPFLHSLNFISSLTFLPFFPQLLSYRDSPKNEPTPPKQ